MSEYQVPMTQREFCNRWQISEATLERWRPPIYVKLCGQVKSGTGEKVCWRMRSVVCERVRLKLLGVNK